MDWEKLAWERGVRRFRDKTGARYTVGANRWWTGRYGKLTLIDADGNRQQFTRRELLGEGARIELPSGQVVRLRVIPGLEEEVDITVDGHIANFAPCNAMKVERFRRLLHRNGLKDTILAVVGSVIATTMIVAGTTYHRQPAGFLVAAFGLVVAYAAYASFRDGWDLMKRELSRLGIIVEQTPELIGWVYAKETKTLSIGDGLSSVGLDTAHTLVVLTTERRMYELRCEAIDLEPALRLLMKRAPHAAAGYSPEQRAAYERLAGARASELRT